MKLFTIIFLLIFHANCYGQDYYFINAESGLNVRSDSNLSSKKIAKIPYGIMVEKISDTNKELIINDNGQQVKGKWVKIKYNNYLYLVSKETKPFEKEGYVFDGFLKEFKNQDVIKNTKIEKEKYEELLRKSSQKIYTPKKIGNLDSIKWILKNRVEWETEFENENYKRDDVIKSITTKNGRKLLINQYSNDYGFAEGWSGYYPEHDILVLEGGHGSELFFMIGTGESNFTIGNPKHIIPSPNNSYRLNAYDPGQEFISYFFQKNINGKFIYLTEFISDYDIGMLKAFYWMSENEFIYSKMSYTYEAENGIEEFFRGEIIE